MKRSAGHQPDYILAGTAVFLILFGLVMLSSAGAVLGFEKFGDSNYFLKKQLISLAVGLVAFTMMFLINYRLWEKLSPLLMLVGLGLLLAVFIPGLGPEYLGAHRWIQIGTFVFQPSEIIKLIFILYLSSWLVRRQQQLHHVQHSLFPFLTILGLVALLIIAQPDLGTTIVIVGTAIILYFTAGAPLTQLGGLAVAGALLLTLAVKIAPYRAQRFTVFLNPSLDPQGIGYHINQALLAIGSGGIFGLGLGHSRQKFNYLPEPAGDSIFAVTAEELGFLVVIIFILAWCLLLYRGLRIARQSRDAFGQYVAMGIVSWLGLQAFFNMAAMLRLMPLTGIPLPLISYGGTAIITSLAGLGLLLNISRTVPYQTH